MTQSDLAAKLKCTKTAVCKWEAGKSVPPLTRFKALAEALEIMPDALFESVGQLPKPATFKVASIDPLLLTAWQKLTSEQRNILLQIALILSQVNGLQN
jgi:transcriptional regulator with XRE-family HTH domain